MTLSPLGQRDTAPCCRRCGYVPRSGEDRRCPAKGHLPSMFRGHAPEDFVDVPLMDFDWLGRLDVHLRAYETTGEPLPLVSLREEIDMAKFVCGLGPDPRPDRGTPS